MAVFDVIASEAWQSGDAIITHSVPAANYGRCDHVLYLFGAYCSCGPLGSPFYSEAKASPLHQFP